MILVSSSLHLTSLLMHFPSVLNNLVNWLSRCFISQNLYWILLSASVQVDQSVKCTVNSERLFMYQLCLILQLSSIGSTRNYDYLLLLCVYLLMCVDAFPFLL